MRRDVQSLIRRLAVLAVLITGAVLVTAEQQGNTVMAADFCQYCSPFHSQCYNYCQAQYDDCILHYPSSVCSDNLYSCALNCDNNETMCEETCDTGGGGGGGGGPKGQCVSDCYAVRGDCLLDDPPPEWIEECLAGGGNRHTCCNEVFYDCVAGC